MRKINCIPIQTTAATTRLLFPFPPPPRDRRSTLRARSCKTTSRRNSHTFRYPAHISLPSLDPQRSIFINTNGTTFCIIHVPIKVIDVFHDLFIYKNSIYYNKIYSGIYYLLDFRMSVVCRVNEYAPNTRSLCPFCAVRSSYPSCCNDCTHLIST